VTAINAGPTGGSPTLPSRCRRIWAPWVGWCGAAGRTWGWRWTPTPTASPWWTSAAGRSERITRWRSRCAPYSTGSGTGDGGRGGDGARSWCAISRRASSSRTRRGSAGRRSCARRWGRPT
jgi:hypothetical protein